MSKGTVNKVILLGRLGQNPEMRATATGTQVATLSVATTDRGPKDAQGNATEVTEWHRVILWAKTAELASQYLKKGSQVYIEGRLQTRKWQDNQGQDKYTTEIVGNEMQFIGGKTDSGQAPQHQQYQPPQPQGGFQKPSQPLQQPAPGQFDDFDDIPM